MNGTDRSVFFSFDLDRNKIILWLKKLNQCPPKSEYSDIVLRNEFLYCLLTCVKNGELRPPFNEVPPTEPIGKLRHLLVLKVYAGDLRRVISHDVDFCFFFSFIEKSLAPVTMGKAESTPTGWTICKKPTAIFRIFIGNLPTVENSYLSNRFRKVELFVTLQL